MQISLWFHGLNLILIFLLTALLTLLKTNFDNTLENHAMWDPIRLQQRDTALGANQFYRSRQTLFGNKLNLHRFGGFHEVDWRGGLLHFPLSVNFKLEKKAELSVIYYTADDLNYGVKLRGSNKHFFFIRNSLNRYEKVYPFQLKTFPEDLNEIEFKLFLDSQHLVLNKQNIELPFEFKNLEINKLSMRGGYEPVFVSQVSFGLEDIVRYRFSFMKEFWTWVLSISPILIGLYIALYFIFKFTWKPAFIPLLLLNIILGGYELLDLYYFKGKYPPANEVAKIKFHNYKIHRGQKIFLINNSNEFNIPKWDKDLSLARSSKRKIYLIHNPAYHIDLKEKLSRAVFKEWANRKGLKILDATPFLKKLNEEGEVWNHQHQLSEFGEKALNLYLSGLE